MLNRKLSLSLIFSGVLFGVSCNSAYEKQETRTNPSQSEEKVEQLASENISLALTTPSVEECTDAVLNSKFISKKLQEQYPELTPEELEALVIAEICTPLVNLGKTYEEHETFTSVTMYGAANAAGEYEYFFGALAYDLTAIKEWREVVGTDGVKQARKCIRPVYRDLYREEEKPFRACVDDRSGSSFPQPLFAKSLSDDQLTDLANAEVIGAAALAYVRSPEQDKAGIAFMAGAADESGSAIGCGWLAAWQISTKTVITDERLDGEYICMPF